MARGSEAKKLIINKLIAAMGSDYIGEFSNKHYFWVKENGVRLQIAVSLTCPKNLVGVEAAPVTGDGIDFEAPPIVAPVQPVVEISEEEKENIQNLMARLGL